MREKTIYLACLLFSLITGVKAQSNLIKPEALTYKPFTWISEPPKDCPFKQSKSLVGIRFLGVKSGFRYGDTWYPTWAANDTLYSPWTDGTTKRLDGYTEKANSGYAGKASLTDSKTNNNTGQGVMIGDDPLMLKTYSTGIVTAPAFPYQGRPVFADLTDAQVSVADYFDYYNHERLHSSIDYQLPYLANQQLLQPNALNCPA